MSYVQSPKARRAGGSSSRFVIALALAAFGVLTSSAVATAELPRCASSDLTLDQANRAAREGQAMAESREGYRVLPWVLFASKDPLRAVHDRSGIDAVIVETPYERLRYESYLQRVQGLAVTPSFVARQRRAASGQIGFVVYAHSRSENERFREFLKGFGRARAVISGRRLVSEKPIIFGPSLDFYDVGTFRESRWTGSSTYRFDVRAGANVCTADGTLELHGPPELPHRFAFDLRRFR